MTLQQRITALVKEHGSLRQAAAAVGIDHAYLWCLKVGEQTNPSDDCLHRLGLQRVVTYVRSKL